MKNLPVEPKSKVHPVLATPLATGDESALRR
jgi:hypothetical protein